MAEKMTPQPTKHEPQGSMPGATEKAGQTTDKNNSGTIPTLPGIPVGETVDPLKASSEKPDSSDAHAIFDERFRTLTDPFGSTCEREGIIDAIAIIRDPKLPRQPIVFLRGSKYEAAKMIASLLRQLQQQILTEISTN